MADPPEDRLNATEPFRFYAVDYFGPFYMKEGCSIKNAGELFLFAWPLEPYILKVSTVLTVILS